MRPAKTIAVSLLVIVATFSTKASAVKRSVAYFEQKGRELDNLIGRHAVSLAQSVGEQLFDHCYGKIEGLFARQLEDETSVAYRCAVGQVDGIGPFLVSALKAASPRDQDELEYLETIKRHFTLKLRGRKEVDRLVRITRSQCQTYIDKTTEFFEEARGHRYTISDDFSIRLLARNACRVFIRTKISERALDNTVDYASEKYHKIKHEAEKAEKKGKREDGIKLVQ